ncbi:hypothetical protein NPIL_560921 [Nephila pilipes]|uniref:Uncharacterized protein n=1 Tax=Nephila pilipes TaxID=299642 RepID=A0A8X6NY19_NEPPI|nr:hypothetical protein NPIL_560921 [Nephila pilipes]
MGRVGRSKGKWENAPLCEVFPCVKSKKEYAIGAAIVEGRLDEKAHQRFTIAGVMQVARKKVGHLQESLERLHSPDFFSSFGSPLLGKIGGHSGNSSTDQVHKYQQHKARWG